MNNLFRNIPADLPEELFEPLSETGDVRIERIVSRGHSTAEGDWLEQDRGEFVVLLEGAARLEFADGRELDMEAGDWLEIPPRCRHRVAWTEGGRDSVWLAVHFRV